MLQQRKGPPSSPAFPHGKGESRDGSLLASLSLCVSSQMVYSTPPQMAQSNTLHSAIKTLQEANELLERKLAEAEERVGILKRRQAKRN